MIFGQPPNRSANTLTAQSITGCVIVGGNQGLIYQVYNGEERPAPPYVDWGELPAHDSAFEIFDLLSWKSRLAETMIGRDDERDELISWAHSGQLLRIRFLVGPGGAGKTRLAAEVADHLQTQGWHAGFSKLEDATPFPICDNGLFLLLDYPEAWRKQVRLLLRKAAVEHKRRPSARIRILLLSRRPFDEWRHDVLDAKASSICDAREIAIRPLTPELGRILFEQVATRLAHHRSRKVPRFDHAAIYKWLERNPESYGLPLLTTAAAVHFIDSADDTLSLRAVDIVKALVDREWTALNRLGNDAGWMEDAAPRLIGLAALRETLDATIIRRLASPKLEIGLPARNNIIDAVRRIGWWTGDHLPTPEPDIVAAELLRQVLGTAADRRASWIWETLRDVQQEHVELLGRRMYDMVSLRPSERVFCDALVEVVRGSPERASAWRTFLESPAGGFRLNPVGIEVGRTILATSHLPESERAQILTSLSNCLLEAGDDSDALSAIREAVILRLRLVRRDRARYESDLAGSLNNLSNCLITLNDIRSQARAVRAVRKAVRIRLALFRKDRGQYGPDLANSLTTLSTCFSVTGAYTCALRAIRAAVAIRRRLAKKDPGRFDHELAGCLNNLSNCLRDSRLDAPALKAIEEAVEIRRRLAEENPGRFDSALAGSLNNLSNRLSEAGEAKGAMRTALEAMKIRWRLTQENPALFERDLIVSVDKLLIRLNDVADDEETQAARRELDTVRRSLEQLHRGSPKSRQ